MKHQTITVPLLGSFMVPDFEIRIKHTLLIVSQMTNASWNGSLVADDGGDELDDVLACGGSGEELR